jgi:5,10-methylenetetrahydromethanopterin reductase
MGAHAGRLGVRFQPGWEPERLHAFAREVERLGYEELWLSEDCFWSGAIALASAGLAVTERLTLGVGLFPAATRNPALAAMEIAAVARMAPGRFVPAFGHGIPEWMEQIGAAVDDRLGTLEDVVTALREILAGDLVTKDGRGVRLRDVQLGHPPGEVPPLLVGTTGAKGLSLAGRVADGLVLPEVCNADAVRWARETAGFGPGEGLTVVFALLSLDDDASAAVVTVRPDVAIWAGDPVFASVTRFAGLDRDEPLTDETIRALAVAGDPDDCAGAVRALWAAGADVVVLLPRSGDGPQQVARFAAEVMPALTG